MELSNLRGSRIALAGPDQAVSMRGNWASWFFLLTNMAMIGRSQRLTICYRSCRRSLLVQEQNDWSNIHQADLRLLDQINGQTAFEWSTGTPLFRGSLWILTWWPQSTSWIRFWNMFCFQRRQGLTWISRRIRGYGFKTSNFLALEMLFLRLWRKHLSKWRSSRQRPACENNASWMIIFAKRPKSKL